MAIETCDRCGEQSAKLLKCNTCKKKTCNSCVKSSRRRKGKVGKMHICKSCWSKMPKRKQFKRTPQPGGYQQGNWRRH